MSKSTITSLKRLCAAFALLLFGFSASTATAQDTYFVAPGIQTDPSGSTNCPGPNMPGNPGNLEDCIEQASANDIIAIEVSGTGTLYEAGTDFTNPLNVDKDLTFAGWDNDGSGVEAGDDGTANISGVVFVGTAGSPPGAVTLNLRDGLRFDLTAGSSLRAADGSQVLGEDEAVSPEPDGTDDTIGEGLVAFSGSGDAAILVPSTEDVLTIDNLVVEKSNATVDFRPQDTNLAEGPAELHVERDLRVTSGALTATNGTLFYDVVTGDRPTLQVAEDAEIAGDGRLTIEVTGGATSRDIVVGEGELNIDTSFDETYAPGDADADLLVDFASIGAGGTSQVGTSSGPSSADIRFTNLATLEGSLTVRGSDSDVYFDQDVTVEGALNVRDGATVESENAIDLDEDLLVTNTDSDLSFVGGTIEGNATVRDGGELSLWGATTIEGELQFPGGMSTLNIGPDNLDADFNNDGDEDVDVSDGQTFTVTVEGDFTSSGANATVNLNTATDADTDLAYYDLALQDDALFANVPTFNFENVGTRGGPGNLVAFTTGGGADLEIGPDPELSDGGDLTLNHVVIDKNGGSLMIEEEDEGDELIVPDYLVVRTGELNANGNLDAGGADVEVVDGQIESGQGDVAYEAEPNILRFTGSTSRDIGPGTELPRGSVEQLVINLQNSDDRVQLTAENLNLNIEQRLAVLEGDLDVGLSTLTLDNEVEVEVGDGQIRPASGQGEIRFPGDAGTGQEFFADEDDGFDPTDPSHLLAGEDGIDLEYTPSGQTETGLEFPTESDNPNVIRDVSFVSGTTVLTGDDVRYQVNNDLTANGGTFDVANNTVEVRASNGNNTDVLVDAGDGEIIGSGWLEFTGEDQTDVTARARESDQIVELPNVRVFKEDDEDDNVTTDPRAVRFVVDDRNDGVGGGSTPDEADGFELQSFVLADAGDFDEDPDPNQDRNVDVTLQSEVDIFRTVDDFTQEGENFLANAANEITIGSDGDGNLVKTAGSFRANGNTTFDVASDLTHSGGTFQVVGGSSFGVGGTLDQSSGATTASFGSGGFTFRVTHDELTVGADLANSAGILRATGSGAAEIGGDLLQSGGWVSIPNADQLIVQPGDITVSSGNFYGNMGPGMAGGNTDIIADGLTVGSEDTAADFRVSSGTATGSAQVVTFTVFDGSRFRLQQGTLQVSGDYALQGSGDVTADNQGNAQGLRGTVVLNGSGEQNVEHRQDPNAYFANLVVNNTSGRDQQGIVQQSDIIMNSSGGLNLQQGILSTETFEVALLNPALDAIPQGSISAAGGALQGGSRISFIDDTFRRTVAQGSATGGTVTSGYYYPLGSTTLFEEQGERPVFRPIVLQFTNLGTTTSSTAELIDEDQANSLGLEIDEPFTVETREPGSNNVTSTLELNTLGNTFYRVEFDEVPAADPNIRIFADRQGGITDISDVRIVRFTCDGENPQLAGTYDLFGDPTDDASVGLNDFINGVPSLTQEGVDFQEGAQADGSACLIFGVASDAEVNNLEGFDGDIGGEIAGTVVTAAGDSVSGATVTAVNSDSLTETTGTEGDFSFADVADGEYTVSATSDAVAGDANITAADALIAIRIFTGAVDPTPQQREAADVNDDGTVNATDALLIAQFAVGAIDEFPAGATFSSTETVTVPSAEARDVTLTLGVFGDLNAANGGSTVAEGGDTDVAAKKAESLLKAARLSSEEPVKVASGAQFEVPVRITSDASLGSATIELSYAADKATFEGVSSSLSNVITHAEDGNVRIAWYNADGATFSANDAVFTLRFEAAKTAEGALDVQAEGELTNETAQVLQDAGLQISTVKLGADVPEEFALRGNHPNPFSGTTTISLDLPKSAKVQVEVVDLLGRRVLSVPAHEMEAGAGQTLTLEGSDLASGTYLYRVVAQTDDGRFVETGKMTLVK